MHLLIQIAETVARRFGGAQSRCDIALSGLGTIGNAEGELPCP